MRHASFPRADLGPIAALWYKIKPTVAIPVEFDTERKIRKSNKLYYRFNHWPIWIFVFFIAPGPLTFDLFERGFDWRMGLWLGAVLVGTGIAGLRGPLPGVEPRPYIIRFTEDRPNPLYRRVCYTLRLERGHHLRRAEHRRAGGRHRDGHGD